MINLDPTTKSSSRTLKDDVHKTDRDIIKLNAVNRRTFLKLTGMMAGAFAVTGGAGRMIGAADAACASGTVTGTVDPSCIPKFVNQLVLPPAFIIGKDGLVDVSASAFKQQILPLKDENGNSTGFGPTTVLAFSGKVKGQSSDDDMIFQSTPGPMFDVIRGVTTKITWINNMTTAQFLPVDPTIHFANPNNIPMPTPPFEPFPPGYPDAQAPIPLTPHRHGGEQSSIFDGRSEAWFTHNGLTGPEFVSNTFTFLNDQEPAAFFYHDHSLGMTRLNVYAGLSGYFLIRDPGSEVEPLLPSGDFELPLIIQDRSFFEKDCSGENGLALPVVGDLPDVHPYWVPEFFGDTIMVNGLVWPNKDVDRGQYRLRLLNFCCDRFVTLTFTKETDDIPFVQIGCDGGFLKSAVTLTTISLGPTERADILIDFSSFEPGTKIVMTNSALTPFSGGTPPDENTSLVMQFTVKDAKGFSPKTLPELLNPTLAGPEFPTLPEPVKTRFLTLTEAVDANDNTLGYFLNGSIWDAPITELPKIGTTEDWTFVNLTDDTHPMHVHLVQFQLVKRQDFYADTYNTDWLKLNSSGLTDGALPFKPDYVPKELDPGPYLIAGTETGPEPGEVGWKDTIKAYPNKVTTIRIRFAQLNGEPYPFDATEGPGYVWHCHILEHEDNEMMRPYKVVKDDP